MNSINLAYKPVPAGHDKPRKEKEHVQSKVIGDLVSVVESFFKEVETHELLISEWEIAKDSLKNIKSKLLSNTNLIAAVAPFIGRPDFNSCIGMFLTNAYNRSSDTEFVYEDLCPGSISRLGWRIKKNNKLLIRGDTYGGYTGYESHGIIINYGDGEDLGRDACNVVINYGVVEDMESFHSPCGAVFINYGIVNGMLCTLGGGFAVNYHKASEFCQTKNSINLGIADTIRENFAKKPRFKNRDKFTHYFSELRDALSPRRSNEEIFSELRKRDIGKDVADLFRGKK